ncbi:MAG: hypothetical protein KJ808_01020 [Acidobacteria bacterium]|nr:hypothetical protein [Acidobacteriota bacterium]MBU4306595.1 hypothetical protein [Acidobacteriota bacterium]MCG2812573.1 hypothetical protein [Candidatus Aminicenantes bacterium]
MKMSTKMLSLFKIVIILFLTRDGELGTPENSFSGFPFLPKMIKIALYFFHIPIMPPPECM